jgi:hypothetical protein
VRPSLGAAACIALVAVACSPKPPTTAAPTPTSPPTTSGPTPPAIVTPTNPSLQGATVSYVSDLTWVSDLRGWLLTQETCPTGLCPVVSSTTDGGVTWQRLPNPPLAPSTTGGVCRGPACQPSHIRFANATDGYLFGPALLATVDGGQTWHPDSAQPVETLEASQGSVFRVLDASSGCLGPCDRIVQEASAGSTDWRTLTNIPTQWDVSSRQDTAQLVVQGSDVFLPIYGDLAAGAGTQEMILFRSLDAGRNWQRLRDPCMRGGGVNVAVGLASAPGSFLTALCMPRGSMAVDEFVVSSADAGVRWGDPHPVPGGFASQIAAASPTRLSVATGPISGSGTVTYTLLSSTDTGAHWRTAVSDLEPLDARAPGSSFLGFEDANFGRWVGDEHAIWTTDDGGLRWVRRPFK